MERRPLIIVGSGPAGTATALFLHQQSPQLAGETVLLEKARHPRPKVCAGGLIPHTLACLRELDVPLSVPHAVVRRARVDVPGRTVDYEEGWRRSATTQPGACGATEHRAPSELCRVVRRDAFDHSLVLACRQRGIEVREEEKLLGLWREADGVRVETTRGSYHAGVVIGADGSGSLVGRQLVLRQRECVGKAVMCDVPVAASRWDGFAAERYDFSFAGVPQGLRGYAWAFPCLIDATPHVNVGVYSVEASGTGPLLRRLLHEYLERLEAPVLPLQSFPIRWAGRGARIAAPHVLLAGDAAGVDPLMGEGISFAFEYGRRAAAAASRALTHAATASDPFGFRDYEAAVTTSWMGKKLRRLELGTHLFYGRTSPLWFAIAARSRQAQDIGIRWYNGVDGWDQRSGWEALRAWWSGELRPRTPAPLSS